MPTLSEFLKTAGVKDKDLSAESLSHIKILGQDPILPTPFKIGELGALALAALGYSIAEISFLQTGERQNVEIEVKKSVLVQRSHQYFRILNAETPGGWDPLSGFYRCKDQQWIQLHCNFPHHRQGVIDVLGCTDDKAAVTEAILNNWSAESLETILCDRGLCASKVRSASEWAEHPQSQAIAHLPVLEIIKVGDSPRECFQKSARPLSGIKVLDLSRVIAGPVCARTLAEHGATVLHISSPHLPSIAPLVMDTGHGKHSAFLDLNQAADHQRLIELTQTADVFLQAYRPGGLNEKGFSLEDLVKVRPGIIYVELSAYSHLGPWSKRHGYDTLVQSATGIADEQGASENCPKHLPAQTLDYVAGYLSAFGVAEALRRRALEGGSYHLRTSLVQVAQILKNFGRVSNFSSCSIPESSDIAELLTQTDTPFGRLEHFAPILKLSNTPAFWSKTTVPLGHDPAEWPK